MAITVHRHIPLTCKICLILLPVCFLARFLSFLNQEAIASSFTVLYSLSAVHHYYISTSSLATSSSIVCSGRGAIQIHIYLTLPLYTSTVASFLLLHAMTWCLFASLVKKLKLSKA